MAKTTRPETDVKDDIADAVEMPAPVVMAEPVVDPSAPEPMTQPPEVSAPGEFEIPPAPEPGTQAASSTPTQAAPQDSKRQSGFGGMVVGGVVAAALGYAVATYAPIAGLSDRTGQADTTLAALTDRIVALENAPSDTQIVDIALTDRVQALEQRTPDLSAVTDAIAALEARVTAIETAPPAQAGAESPELAADVEALRAEVAALKGSGADVSAEIAAAAADATARLAEAEAQAAQLKAEAEETARKSMARAALSRVQASLESGAPFASALENLGGLKVPAVLADSAETGIPSQSALEDAFPPAARAALEASLQANMGESLSERMASFLQSTTGARSLTPREGTDPDAVLSRAEAAIQAGDMDLALTELQGLPPEGQAAMADFTAMAQKRAEATKAVAALSAAIEG